MKKTLNPGTLLGPVPVVLVSLGQGEEQNIITVAWTGIINSEPPMTYISVRKSRYSHDILLKEKEFVINLVSSDIVLQTDFCGVKSGRDVDKFKECNFTPEKCDTVKCPMIAECPVNLECKVVEVKELPSHDMFIAEIVGVHVNEEIMDEDGKADFRKAKLAAYLHGEYFGLKKERIGKFGFSVMHEKTKKRIQKEEHEKRVADNKKKRESKKALKEKSYESKEKKSEYGEKKSYGGKRSYGGKKSSGEKKNYGEKKSYGARKQYGEKSSYGERKFKKDYDRDFSKKRRYDDEDDYGYERKHNSQPLYKVSKTRIKEK